MPLAHKTYGESGRPTVVLLHGFMGSTADWDEVASALARRHHVVAVDLPGHGASPLPERSFDMDDLVPMLDETLQAANASSFGLMGYSMGGRAALLYALRRPDRCKRLFLESSTPGIPSEKERLLRRLADDAQAARMLEIPVRDFLEEWYRQPVFSSLRKRPDLLDRLIESRQQIDPQRTAMALRCLSTGRQAPLWDDLQRLTMPTLAMAGALDGKYVGIAETMGVAAAHITTEVVQDAGHIVHLEKPQPFLESLSSFFEYLG